MPMQYVAIFTAEKIDNFQMKILDIFLISAFKQIVGTLLKNIVCGGYMLE